MSHFRIESVSLCKNGRAPRWTWWIRGIHGSPRYGILGTDEQGRGLYHFLPQGNAAPKRTQLLPSDAFSLSLDASREETVQKLRKALIELGWHKPLDAATQHY